ncbi:MAG: hypothetical protein HY901_01945 [Deltaproteobacteria bacterium]|nr:hypothetical protein [Deltaproteobacteria bacterium]
MTYTATQLAASLALGTMLAMPGRAGALTQPNGQTIPSALGCEAGQPSGLATVFACTCLEPGTCNLGAPCPTATSCDDGEHGTCETTLWHEFNDNICLPSNLSGLDPVAAAGLVPETFWPSGPLTFTLLTRGTALFKDVFGWYNATSSPPAATDLHVMLDCNAAAGATVTLDLCSDPAYLGGPVGFFLITPQSHASTSCASGDCCAAVARLETGTGYAYYSESAHDPDFVGESSFIHLLLYPSHIFDHRTYFAWEDQYASGGTGTFTQMVVAVDGLQADSTGVCTAGPDAGAPDAETPDAAPAGVDAATLPDAASQPDGGDVPQDAASGPDATLAPVDASSPRSDASIAVEVGPDGGHVTAEPAGCSCGSVAGPASFALLGLVALAAAAARRWMRAGSR